MTTTKKMLAGLESSCMKKYGKKVKMLYLVVWTLFVTKSLSSLDTRSLTKICRIEADEEASFSISRFGNARVEIGF